MAASLGRALVTAVSVGSGPAVGHDTLRARLVLLGPVPDQALGSAEDQNRQHGTEDRGDAAADQRPAGSEDLTDPADDRRADRSAAHEDHHVQRHRATAHDWVDTGL